MLRISASISRSSLTKKVTYLPLSCFSRSFWWSDKKPEAESLESDHSVVIEPSDAKELVPQFGESIPKHGSAIILPSTTKPLFPGSVGIEVIHNKKIIDTLTKSRANGATFVGMFYRKHPVVPEILEPELITNIDDIHRIGTFASVQGITDTKSGGVQLFLSGHRRISLDHFDTLGPPAYGRITHWKKTDVPINTPTIKAYMNEIIYCIKEVIKINPIAAETMQGWMPRLDSTNPYTLADFAAILTSADGSELQRVLEAKYPEERLELVLELVKRETELAKLQREIQQQVEKKVNKQHRDYMLKEQLKSINKELGIEKDDKEELLNKYRAAIKTFEANVKPETLKVINDEVNKLSSLERSAPEYNVARSYLDWLTSLPWGKYTSDELLLQKAREILDRDHYGLEDVKSRILEFIAVSKLKGAVNGKIVCFIGPPGVGKTSVAKSIATALGRSFYRFSVGGLTDIAEIKGHRRTYIGAMPGKPIQCLKSTGYANPLILIDEVDKIAKGYQGDPSSALLELLDPNQNGSFVDHYLDVPFDFSHVLFVCTANDEGAIPGPLRDRMEIIRITGYDIPEKIAIASKYLIPKVFQEAGLTEESGIQVNIGDATLEAIIRNYCRESGVRSLEQHIEKIARKLALQAVSKKEGVDVSFKNENQTPLNPGDAVDTSSDSSKSAFEVTVTNLPTLIGKPRFPQETIYGGENGEEALPVGVVMGLAWNPMGGSPVFIEAAAIPTAVSETGGSVNVVTGQLGNVMKESVSIAYTFARRLVMEKHPENDFFKRHTLHIHVPEGAVEKDGPSAGVAMAMSLISLSTNTPLRPRLAMTGELSLTGKVLPVGGIKEKILAAKRSGANTVCLPATNQKDYDELPQYVKDSLTVHFIREFDEAFAVCFPNGASR